MLKVLNNFCLKYAKIIVNVTHFGLTSPKTEFILLAVFRTTASPAPSYEELQKKSNQTNWLKEKVGGQFNLFYLLL